MNEKGLVVGVLYLPGFAEFEPYDAAKADRSMGPSDLASFLLTQFAAVDEVRAGHTTRQPWKPRTKRKTSQTYLK